MKKLKFDLSNLPGAELLTKEQLKKVMGGLSSNQCALGHKSCVGNSNCGRGEACVGIPGCCDSTLGKSCTSNSTCGNNQSCVNNPIGGKWCNYN